MFHIMLIILRSACIVGHETLVQMQEIMVSVIEAFVCIQLAIIAHKKDNESS